MKTVFSPYLEAEEVKNFMEKNSFIPVSPDEAVEYAKKNPLEKKIVCPECFFPNGYLVGIHKGNLVSAGSSFFFKGTKFLVK